jgi:hypothetical protein
MTSPANTAAATAVVLVGAGVALWALWRYGLPNASQAAGNAVQAVGETVGLPRTDRTRCEDAKARGAALDASIYCPAGEFVAWQWSRLRGVGNRDLSNPASWPDQTDAETARLLRQAGATAPAPSTSVESFGWDWTEYPAA